MRKSFKVATVFTGVAALAGAFGPTALAATAKPTVIPDIGNQECLANNGGISHWVHLYYPNNDHPAECFHGTGIVAARATITQLCPGNNWGNLYGRSTAHGNSAQVSFFPGGGRHPFSFGNLALSAVSITGWSGSARC